MLIHRGKKYTSLACYFATFSFAPAAKRLHGGHMPRVLLGLCFARAVLYHHQPLWFHCEGLDDLDGEREDDNAIAGAICSVISSFLRIFPQVDLHFLLIW